MRRAPRCPERLPKRRNICLTLRATARFFATPRQYLMTMHPLVLADSTPESLSTQATPASKAVAR